MQLFFVEYWSAGKAKLSADESRHCTQVLRKKTGDEIFAVDGKGNFLNLRIGEVTKKQVFAEVLSVIPDWQPMNYHLHLLVAPTKNTDRLEWLLEKATEIGLSRITPVICQRSERKVLRPDRLQKVLLAAMKQSLKARLPVLDEAIKLKDCLKAPGFTGKKYIAHCAEGVKVSLRENYSPGSDVMVLIGPEGDFTPEELALAQAQGWQPLGLGPSRLRTETAALVACTMIYELNI